MLAVKVTVLLAVVPTMTLPKLKLPGEIVRVPEVGGVVPPLLVVLPDRGTYSLPPFAHNIVSIAEKVPRLFGANFTEKVVLFPELKFSGVLIPEIWNELDPPPFSPTHEIFATLPLLLKVTD